MESITYKHDIVGYRNFVPTEDLPKIIAYFESMNSNWGDVAFKNSLGMGIPPVDPSALEYGLTEDYFGKIREKYQNAVELTHGRKVKPNTTHAQKWEVGGVAYPHSDNSDFNGNPNAFEINKYVGILYLNDDYEGGELYFPDHNIKIKPEAGMFVTFPGGHENIHGVTVVTEGTRYTMVSFWDYAEAEYSEERKAEWELEIKGIRELQAKDREEEQRAKLLQETIEEQTKAALEESTSGKKRIYFLHIQKTGGRDLIQRLTYSDHILASYMIGYKEDPFKVEHLGFTKDQISPDTYVFTALRDPIARGISHYAHKICLSNATGTLKPDSEIDFSLLTFDKMWAHFQSRKNLGKYMTISLFEDGFETIQDFVRSSDDYYKSEEEIDKQLSKFNKVIKLENFTEEKFMDFRKELHGYVDTENRYPGTIDLDDQNFYSKSVAYLPVETFTNKYSRQLYESLTEEQIQLLKEYYKLDYYTYSKAT